MAQKILSLFLILGIGLSAFGAECDPSTIKQNVDGTYTYSRDCHVWVGQTKKRLTLLEDKVVQLEKKIELKDLAILKQEEIANHWRDTSFKLNDKLNTYEAVRISNQRLYFVGGLLTALASAYVGSRVLR